MKRFTIKSLLAISSFLFALALNSFAQDECKVLLESIAGSYDGECKKGVANGNGTAKGLDSYVGVFKKGLPHGDGTYTWANGEIYEGAFKKGLKDGKGKLTVKLPDGQIKGQEGYWVKDKYIGENENPHKVIYRSPGVLSVRITETENKTSEESALFIDILHKGKVQVPATFEFSERTGSFIDRFHKGNSTLVLVATFPFGFTLNYLGESVQIDIYQNTSWSIIIDFNK